MNQYSVKNKEPNNPVVIKKNLVKIYGICDACSKA